MNGSEHERLILLKPNMKLRAEILGYIRRFFRDNGFLEVDTPIRVPALAPELYIPPLTSEGWYLITSPELHMKRLLAAGYDKIFQICHCFRKGECGKLHNPEFTMLEWYRAHADYLQMIEDTENLLTFLTEKLGGGEYITYKGKSIDITRPWPRVTVRDAFLEYCSWDPVEDPDSLRFDMDLVEKVMPALRIDRPVVFLDYPSAMASLSRVKQGNPEIAERAEVFIGGMEIANAYSELNNRQEQERRFKEEIEKINEEYGYHMELPVKFLEELEYMPEAGGIALGVDRLVMLFCDAGDINDVISFPVDNI